MQLFKVQITGKTPLICNRFTEAAQLKATSGATIAAAAGDKGSPKEQAEPKLYVHPKTGKPCIPQPNIFKCIIEGGKFFKAGKSKVTTMKSSLIPACVELEAPDGDLMLTITSKDGWEVDTRPVRIPSTGGRILTHRPIFHDWKLDFHITLDNEMMDSRLLHDIVEAAGKRIGLGDFRPDCKGPFGKFYITHWKELPIPKQTSTRPRGKKAEKAA